MIKQSVFMPLENNSMFRKFKLLVTLLLALSYVPIFANMANPVREGTLGSRPFVNQYVDVVHENLYISIDENFENALFNVEYHINSSEDGVQIPFLFYASEFLDSFVVKIDGKEVIVKEVPSEYNVPEGTKFKDFSYFFEPPSHNSYSSVLLEETPTVGFFINFNNMVYFETDITKGKHLIEVSYIATEWVHTREWVNDYSFRYALSPAKYWKSFGTLHVEVDATKHKKSLTTNLGEPNEGNLDAVAMWDFDKLPVEVLQVKYTPTINNTAQNLLKIGPSGLAYITGILLAIVHLVFLIKYRKQNPTKKYSVVLIAGSILVPLIFVFSWLYYYSFIDSMIGPDASGKHGYNFFVVLLYPFILPFYWVVFWLIDRWVKKGLVAKS